MRIAAVLSLPVFLCSCNTAPEHAAPAKAARHAKITQFYATDKMIPKGLPGKLCYGVENAQKLELNPPSEDVWPAVARCFEISPKHTTTFTLTAYGDDGDKDVKSVDVSVGGAPPRVYDLNVNSLDVHAGEPVQVCFKTENATKVKAGPGKFTPGANCLSDNPRKTTTYRIIAYGSDQQEDTGTVTVKVH